ncbi:hypothetical protein AALO_G00199500 [Alosa alosa]|uniref:Uncharacterized protein n=1 Tax=Alosa alosa TaxID=278164 RepID=A0AAV6G258_9TELE|nr:hypothetical protein AALO_G00199500 [Alosa alosa]
MRNDTLTWGGDEERQSPCQHTTASTEEQTRRRSGGEEEEEWRRGGGGVEEEGGGVVKGSATTRTGRGQALSSPPLSSPLLTTLVFSSKAQTNRAPLECRIEHALVEIHHSQLNRLMTEE